MFVGSFCMHIGVCERFRSKCFILKTLRLQSWEKKISRFQLGVESRVKGRGVLIRGWASQVLILSHPAMDAFLTKCGWNSTIEEVCAGVPMITWPQFAEQFFNERLVVQVLGTGVGVMAQRVMHLDDDNRDTIQVKRGDVCKAVKMAMDEGREGEERREKAKYLKQMAAKTLEEEGSSQLTLKLFIEEIRLHTHKGQLVG
ncbi:putative UDP-glucuronosyl/UDP-glucosyltransferase [Helianthus debilis subsp. tardiflorus]